MPELDKVIFCMSILCGFQGGDLCTLGCNYVLQTANFILQGLKGSGDDLLELAGVQDKNGVF